MANVKQRTTGHDLVLFDRDCAFCCRTVTWLAANDLQGTLAFEPFQTADISPELRKACIKAVHVITRQGKILSAGRAALWALRATKWRRLARFLELPIFQWPVEIGYSIVARNRPFFSRFF